MRYGQKTQGKEGSHPQEFSLKSANRTPRGPDLEKRFNCENALRVQAGKHEELGSPGLLLKGFYDILHDQINSFFFFFNKYKNLLWVHKLIACVPTKAFS